MMKSNNWQLVVVLLLTILVFQSHSSFAEESENTGTIDNDIEFDTVFNLDMPMSTSFLTDSDGFIWLPTQNGLVRYDGYETVIFKTGSNSISNDYVTSIIEDSRGKLWIGTQGGGLDLYDKESNQFTNFRHSQDVTNDLGSNTVSINPQSIMEDHLGHIWVATQEGGISVLDPNIGTFRHYTFEENNDSSLTSNQIWSLLEDDEGYVWAGAGNGLNRIDPTTGAVVRFINDSESKMGIGPGWVYRIVEDKQDKDILWLGLVGSGLHKFNKNTLLFEQFLYPDGDGTDQVLAMIEDDQNNLWIGWYDSPVTGGLAIFDKKTETFTPYNSKALDETSLGTNRVFAINQDDNGIIWIVHLNGLIQKYDPAARNFKHYQHIPGDESSISDNALLSYYEDRSGTMWFGGVNSGLIKYNNSEDTFTSYIVEEGSENGLISKFVSRIFEDSGGDFYVAGRGGHLSLFDRELGKVVKTYSHNPDNQQSLGANDSIRSIIEDQDDKNILYIGSFLGGFHIFDKSDETFINYVARPNVEGSLQTNSIAQVHQDPYTGNIWLASNGGGVISFDRQDGSFESYLFDPDNPVSVGSNNIWEIKQYEENFLWIATVGGGLNKMNLQTGEVKRYDKESGFIANTILTIQKDSQGFLWLGTDEGLVRFDEKTNTSKVYSDMDGLQGNVFLDAAAWYSKDGTMWFGGVNGVNRFDPSRLVENQVIPPVVLTSLTQGGIDIEVDKALSRLEEISLTLQDNFFEFSFAALNYTRTSKNQYAYKLEGLDNEWYYSGDKRFGRYSGLAPGSYTLRVKGSNNDGYWNEEGLSLTIEVVPPFYRTKLFYIGMVVLGILALILAYYLRVGRINRQKKELQAIVKKRTQELEDKNEEETAMNEELTALNEELTALNTELHDSNHQLVDMQNMLVQTEKMTAMGNLVVGLAHEINTPIGVGVTASSNLTEIVDEYREKINDQKLTETEQIEYLEDISESSVIIQKNIERAGKLIRNFKLVSTDQSNARVRSFIVKDYLEEIIMTLKPMLHRFDVEVLITCDAYMEIESDPGNLSQIITNLVQNALKHAFRTEQEGIINIECKIIGEKVSLKLRDNGIGMSEDMLSKIFDPFYTTKRGDGGTGLGLYIVYNIVTQQLKGSIRCNSELGKGTEYEMIWSRIQEKVNE